MLLLERLKPSVEDDNQSRSCQGPNSKESGKRSSGVDTHLLKKWWIFFWSYSSYKHISVIKIADFSWSNKGNHFVKKVNNSYIARTVWCRSNFERAGVLWRRAGFLLGARFLRRALFWGLTSLARRFIKIGYDRRHRDVGTGVVSRTDSDRKTGKVGPLNDDLFLKICILM